LKHASPEALDRLDPLLADLRLVSGLRERKRGVFYHRSAAFLHFHEDPAGLFADIRGEDGAFDRIRVDTAGGRDALLERVRGRLPDGQR
jgi:hypothetical protein